MKRVGDIIGKNLTPDQPEGESAASRTARPAVAAPDVCPICKGKGFLIYDVPPGHPDFNRLVPCRCTEARVVAERTRSLRSSSNLTAFERMTFDTFLPDGAGLPEAIRSELRMVYELCWQYAQHPEGWLVLVGGFGAGKTHLAAAIANHAVALGRPVLFEIVPDLLDYLRAAFGPNSESGLDERLDTVRETPLLILDDLGAHNSTAWAQEKLFQILNHRYNHRLPTVITTNQRVDELDPRIASRLQDLDVARMITLNAPDYRAGGSGLAAADRSGRTLNSLALYADKTFDNFSLRRNEDMDAERKANLERALQTARKFAQNPKNWLVFSGVYGCGKTHLAAAIANYQVARGQPVPMFVVVPDLLDYLRATFSPASPTTLDRAFEQVKNVGMLILDDLGTESATPWAREKLFQLLNYRYVSGKATVITTSAKITEIEPRLQSRMLDTTRCVFFAITAPSFRGSEAQRMERDEPQSSTPSAARRPPTKGVRPRTGS